MGRADNFPRLKEVLGFFFLIFPEGIHQMEVLSGVGGHTGLRCSERRIGCLSFFCFSSLIFFFFRKRREKRMVELNMKKLHRNYLGLEFFLPRFFFLRFHTAIVASFAPVWRMSPLVLIIATNRFNAKFPRGTNLAKASSASSLLMG